MHSAGTSTANDLGHLQQDMSAVVQDYLDSHAQQA